MNFAQKFENRNEDNASKIEDLFGHGVKASKIDSGDEIPIGGKRFGEEMNITMECDFEELEDFRERFNQGVQQLTKPERIKQIQEWLDKSGVDVDPKLFAKLVVFGKTYKKKFKGKSKSSSDEGRRSLYQSDDKQAKISDVLESGTSQCAEIAALAQHSLQDVDIESSYVGGDILRDKEHEFSDEHSFILIEHGDKEYIYDPANPVQTNQGPFPSLYRTEASFDDEIHKQKKRFVKAQNIISDREVYFGVSDGTNIIPERDLIG